MITKIIVLLYVVHLFCHPLCHSLVCQIVFLAALEGLSAHMKKLQSIQQTDKSIGKYFSLDVQFCVIKEDNYH